MTCECRMVGTSCWWQIQGGVQVLLVHSACTLCRPSPPFQECKASEECKVGRGRFRGATSVSGKRTSCWEWVCHFLVVAWSHIVDAEWPLYSPTFRMTASPHHVIDYVLSLKIANCCIQLINPVGNSALLITKTRSRMIIIYSCFE